MSTPIPVALFAYARPQHLSQCLARLRANEVPLIYAFSDGPRTPDKEPAVAQVRDILRAIDWCEVVLCERTENLGLGRSIRAGVTSVLEQHDALLVVEEDLIIVPGAYQYLSAALRHYQDEPAVMSVAGWTHPRVIPKGVTDQPYFDGRAECWVWGTWARAWQGMDQDAMTLMRECERRRLDTHRYGADLPIMAEAETRKNIWAVRWYFLHLLRGGLCLRPPHSLVEHIGFDALATNSFDPSKWSNPPLQPCPPLPRQWPLPKENPQCGRLWRKAQGRRLTWADHAVVRLRIVLGGAARRAGLWPLRKKRPATAATARQTNVPG